MSKWYVLCDVCGRKIYNVDSYKRWDGMIVCPNDYESKHPSLTYRPKVGGGGAISAGSIGTTGDEDTSQSVLVCDVYTSMGVVGFGTTGCARSGSYNLGLPLPVPINTPEIPYTIPYEATDPNTIFLMHGNNLTKDWSVNDLTGVRVTSGDGAINLVTVPGVLNNSVIRFTGTNGAGYIEFTHPTGYNLTPGQEFCVEFWYKQNGVSDTLGALDANVIFTLLQDTTVVWDVAMYQPIGTGFTWWRGGGSTSATAAGTTRKYYVFESDCPSPNDQTWVNGAFNTGYTSAGVSTFNKIRIGNTAINPTKQSFGEYDEIRISKIKRYTLNTVMTPPTVPFVG